MSNLAQFTYKREEFATRDVYIIGRVKNYPVWKFPFFTLFIIVEHLAYGLDIGGMPDVWMEVDQSLIAQFILIERGAIHLWRQQVNCGRSSRNCTLSMLETRRATLEKR